jgi:two-component system, OmpR family, sensor kinase
VSLRTRLLLGLLTLAIVGLLVADVVTYASLSAFLTDRVDQELVQSRDSLFHALGSSGAGPGQPGGGPGNAPPGGPVAVPPGTYAALIDPNGTILQQVTFGFSSAEPAVQLKLPQPLPLPKGGTPAPFTVAGEGGAGMYRVAIQAPDPNDPAVTHGTFLVAAIPLQDVASTLSRLLVVEVGVGAAVLMLLAGVGSWAVRFGLRPLDAMAETAGAIAAGELQRRVSPATQRTEVGRLGLALNAMLTQIEQAFAARTASEERLRRFIADASHELRTPLSSIRGYAELFRRGAGSRPEDLVMAMQRIEDEAARMGRLVDDLLLLARLDEGRPLERGPVDLSTLAHDAATDARVTDPRRTIGCILDDEVIVIGDDYRLRQVVGNLVRNALIHTPAGTPLEIRVTSEEGDGVLTVIDHGPGIAPDRVEKIFERFYRADPGSGRDHGGSGLGLSIVAAVVAAHAGAVRLSTTPGGGATFTVRLPLFAPDDQAVMTPADEGATPAIPVRSL